MRSRVQPRARASCAFVFMAPSSPLSMLHTVAGSRPPHIDIGYATSDTPSVRHTDTPTSSSPHHSTLDRTSLDACHSPTAASPTANATPTAAFAIANRGAPQLATVALHPKEGVGEPYAAAPGITDDLSMVGAAARENCNAAPGRHPGPRVTWCLPFSAPGGRSGLRGALNCTGPRAPMRAVALLGLVPHHFEPKIDDLRALVGPGRSRGSGGVLAAAGATGGAHSWTSQDRKGRADIVIYDVPEARLYPAHLPSMGGRL
ncbi:hypothetical protein C8Q77DRAFT_1071511 [Trametes polyzona]|nr:hypothetical protein C8Q77DRAFT_1071511 [Trametes polyzona]